jgi:ketol-acid reductoisomerase
VARVYGERETDLEVLGERSVAVLGYDAEGEAHALCLRDSGIDVRVVTAEARGVDAAEAEGLRVVPLEQAVVEADVLVIVGRGTPPVALEDASVLRPGSAVVVSRPSLLDRHGPLVPGVDYGLLAAQGAPALVRRRFADGAGVPALVAPYVDATGSCLPLLLSYARALGLSRAGVLETTVQEYARAVSLAGAAFGPGGAVALLDEAFAVLVEAGCDRDVAYLSCTQAARAMTSSLVSPGPPGMRPPRSAAPAGAVALLDRAAVRRQLQHLLGPSAGPDS